ncbi:MAG: putative polyketide biosynthesis zinc-dependent hydrolase BaeB [Syntrophorhabdaceae bacterium PtaU1.Bin034]|jgi:hydroxyacylglutathione hydrolase|nr:MAG: putative polyketide biosynthesis zinc-dependent hydrolase BaeB [Syntrophorhabdaceae bacterium PtaU1.Bin034]
MLFERIESEGLSHYSYLVGFGNSATVIDPRRDCRIYVEKAAREGMRIDYVFETHRNEDYLIGSVELASITGAEIWHADAQWDYRYGKPVSDGQEWRLGPLKIMALASPGHTPGMMSYLLHDDHGAPWMVFTGDALFAGEVGRVDFMGTDKLDEMAALLYDTLFGRLLTLGDGVIVCPAHGPGSVCGSAISNRVWTTIGLERCNNPKLQLCEPFEFVAATAKDLEKAPYFRQMERLNLEGAPPLGQLPVPTPLAPAQFREKMKECAVVDTRMPESFGNSHIDGSLSIWLEGIPGFAGWFLTYDKPLLLVVDEGEEEKAVRYLVRMGYDHIAGRLSGGMLSWHKAGEASAWNGTVTAPRMCSILDSTTPTFLLDVRSQEELDKEGRITNAHHIHITQLPRHLDEIPKDRPVYVFCGSGLRSTIAASILQKEGWNNVSVVLGGFAGWQSITCPVQK